MENKAEERVTHGTLSREACIYLLELWAKEHGRVITDIKFGVEPPQESRKKDDE
ncbi:MAG: hypothetical protein LUE21_07075 [Oscillospiraceae bacterium]|nr:hypothetical protein [Oscillospiraceae bacterium]